MNRLTTKHSVLVLGILVISGIAASCSTVQTATTPDFEEFKLHHQTIAIIPFDVTVNNDAYKKVFLRWFSEQELELRAKRQEEHFRRALFTQLSLSQQAGRFTVEFQNIDETQTLLERAAERDGTRKDLSSLSKSEICEILNVDAIITGSMTVIRLRSPVAQVRWRLGLGWGENDRTNISMSIHESETGKLLWNYDHTLKGHVIFADSQNLAKSLNSRIPGIVRNFPYEN